MEQSRDFVKEFWEKIKEKGYKITSQRKYIIDVFLKLGGHVSAEDIFEEIKRKSKKDTQAKRIGIATIYRTLKILKNLGLASERDFGDGRVRYEVSSEHHDHLICKECGLTIEFMDEEIEQKQKYVAQKYGFLLVSHRHELIGICPNCLKKKSET
ncbi:MAG: transcriptional repressor [Candidatus Calescibacterium sp.]|nr:transcriptional repressor [Candidatus Calescibacterium sp.]MCX7734519.1 transcriptional repressor [bacterium]MDW8087656.1 Fur family transcriptional regulator [Candidatus Calescibacterium sp.]